MKLLRLTRQPASKIQQAEIGRIWGVAVEVYQVSAMIPKSPKAAVKSFDELAAGYDVAEVVLSINLLQAILDLSEFSKQGKQIVRSVMVREVLDDGSIVSNFSHYEVIKEINVVTERL